jgi:single-strand DNA-binding protein
MQPSVNKVILLGTIGEKIEFRHLENGGALCRFSVATLDSFTDTVSGEKKILTDWHSVTSWGNQAKEIYKQLKQGKQLYLEAKLKMRTWQSKEGITHKGYVLFLDNYVLLNTNSKDIQNKDHYSQVDTPVTPAPLPGFEISDLDELPF